MLYYLVKYFSNAFLAASQTYIAYSFREKLLENIYTFFKKFHLKTYSYSYLLCVRILSWKKMVDFFDGRSSLRNMPVQSSKFFVFSVQTLQWNYLKKSVYFMSLELIVGESTLIFLWEEKECTGFFSAPNLTPARKGQPFWWCYCSTQIIKHSTIIPNHWKWY